MDIEGLLAGFNSSDDIIDRQFPLLASEASDVGYSMVRIVARLFVDALDLKSACHLQSPYLHENKMEHSTILPRTNTFEHTITGLLGKRAQLYNEAERIRDRLAEIKNDIGALDRTLNVLGYDGDLDTAMPRQKREVIFGRGELSKAIMAELRHAEAPLSSRDIAREIITVRGEDARDRNYISELTRRVSKALRGLRDEDLVKSATDLKGNLTWERR